jgi:hypothetical protein
MNQQFCNITTTGNLHYSGFVTEKGEHSILLYCTTLDDMLVDPNTGNVDIRFSHVDSIYIPHKLIEKITFVTL